MICTEYVESTHLPAIAAAAATITIAHSAADSGEKSKNSRSGGV